VEELRRAIDAFIAVYNAQAAPFEWTKRYVHPVSLNHKYAYLNH
jgi:hypothetical protein